MTAGVKARNNLDYIRENSEEHGVGKASQCCSPQIAAKRREVSGMGAHSNDQTIEFADKVCV